MNKKLIYNFAAAIVFAGSLTQTLFAAPEAGTLIFEDNFEKAETFTKNWVINGNTKLNNGVVNVGGLFNLRQPLPKEFFVECDVTINHDMKKPTGFAGMMIGIYRFQVQPSGKSFMVWRTATDKHTMAAYKPIEGFALGKPVHCALARTINGNRVTYTYFINGKFIDSFVDSLPAEPEKEPFAKLMINSYRIDSLIVDNFKLSTVKQSEVKPSTPAK